MFDTAPQLSAGEITIRGIRNRDAKVLERELTENRSWLQRWEATLPGRPISGRFDTRASIRHLNESLRDGTGLPFAIEVAGEFAGQLNVSGIVHGALSSASLGYWVAQRFAGRGAAPAAVALATDYCLFQLGLHRMEVCVRPENVASLRVVEKLGFRFEGLRRRYIHIDGDWRDHLCFALVREELPEPVLTRWESGRVPPFDRAVYPVAVGDRSA